MYINHAGAAERVLSTTKEHIVNDLMRITPQFWDFLKIVLSPVRTTPSKRSRNYSKTESKVEKDAFNVCAQVLKMKTYRAHYGLITEAVRGAIFYYCQGMVVGRFL